MITNEVIDSFTGEYRFLSNFWPCEILVWGQKLPSVEHAYVAMKCNLLGTETLKHLSTLTPAQVKRYGRSIPMRQDWDSLKHAYMRGFVLEKFTKPELREKLLATGDALLVEGNTWGDIYWGVDMRTGKGENFLGKILMQTRDELK